MVFSKPRLIPPFPLDSGRKAKGSFPLACAACSCVVPPRSMPGTAIGAQPCGGGERYREFEVRDGARIGLVRALSCLSSQAGSDSAII